MASMTDNDLHLGLDSHYSVTELAEPADPLRARRTALTPRELDVVQLLAEGKSNKQIAAELAISVRTVEVHRSHVMRKIHVRSVVGLVYYAMDHGIVPRR
ncbi:MAG TPA: response regulator transcription factor [Candidatus Binatia bacterium]|nr:response regulator transcription factor [Candidatus Binatia bacterium]